VTAFEEALQILRGFWDNADGTLKFEGEFYHASGARPGPAPAHRIPIWTGAYGPRMLDLTGRLADGTLFTSNYLAPEGLDEANRRIDQGAQKAGRSESEVRRGYNIMGVISPDSPDAAGWNEGQLAKRCICLGSRAGTLISRAAHGYIHLLANRGRGRAPGRSLRSPGRPTSEKPYPECKAPSRSVIISSGSSMPTDNRTRPSDTPILARSAGVSERWEEVAG
jgi:alkanesulfonate monooxygenase SsuD/methylene tetrahydromethanopterin reductase-like flavin-dependent oxidoreductase (luciferase family)